MKVLAKQLGYYDHKRRREGEVFTIKAEKEFSHVWMEAVDGPAPKKAKAQKAKDAEPKPSGDKEVI